MDKCPIKVSWDRPHWYDGHFYARFIDPWAKESRREVSALLREGASVIEIGCGTGALSFRLASEHHRVVGIDQSSKMVNYALDQKTKEGVSEIDFLHMKAERLAEHLDRDFDYAVMTFVLHEIQAEKRLRVIYAMRQVAEEVIIADYQTPQPKSLFGAMVQMVEFLAFGEHSRGFRSYISGGGLRPLLLEAGLDLKQERCFHHNTSLLVRAS